MAAVIVVTIFASACQGDSSDSGDGLGSGSVRGAILRVESLSLTNLGALEIRDESGKTWTFDAQGKRFALFTPSHLNEHQVLGLHVLVSYHRDGDVLVIDDIRD